MNIPGLINAFRASGAIEKYRICAHGNADGTAVQALAMTTPLIGVSTDVAAADGETVDVIRSGLAKVAYGGNVTRGDALTVASGGLAIKVNLPAAVNTYIIGFAEVSGVVGDIGSVNISPSVIPATV